MSDDATLQPFGPVAVDLNTGDLVYAADDPLLRALDRVIARKRTERQPRPGEQVITGAYGTQDYAAVMSCYRQHKKLGYQGSLYRVRWVQIRDGRFRAGVVECHSQ